MSWIDADILFKVRVLILARELVLALVYFILLFVCACRAFHFVRRLLSLQMYTGLVSIGADMERKLAIRRLELAVVEQLTPDLFFGRSKN